MPATRNTPNETAEVENAPTTVPMAMRSSRRNLSDIHQVAPVPPATITSTHDTLMSIGTR